MKTIYLLRHAKSSRDDPSLDDADRPLNKRGRDAARRMAAEMKRRGVAPDLILCSPSRRTRETLSLIQPSLPGRRDALFESDLYLADEATLLRRLRRLDDTLSSVVLIGHDPGIHRLAITLAGNGPSDAMDALNRKFPTGALAAISFPLDHWRDLGANGRLELFLRPKELASRDDR